MSMNPGQTTRPVASMDRAAWTPATSPRKIRTVSPSTPTAAL